LEDGTRTIQFDAYAQEAANGWFFANLQALDESCQRSGARGLGNYDDHLRLGIRFEGLQRGEGGRPANCIGQIVAAGAYGVGDASAGVMHLAGKFLQSGAGRADRPDGTRADDVGEPEAHPVDQAGATIGSNYVQTLLNRK
jgi:hypothetical protein